MDAPDLEGRAKILEVHAQGKPIALDVDLRSLAKRTPGYTGAEQGGAHNTAHATPAGYHTHTV